MGGVSHTHLVIIPSYNTGARLVRTVTEALNHWRPVLVVIDGSTDASDAPLDALAQAEPGLKIIRRTRNGGKGAAVLTGLRAAMADGFTHALVMDADGQHPAAEIGGFMTDSQNHPDSMILGLPLFDGTAPRIRLWGRKLSNLLVRFETGEPIGDALFGFRVYPAAPLHAVMADSCHMRRYDFDTESVVRLCWRGVPLRSHQAPVRYFRADEGGVSHFRYGRDNFCLAAMHARLLAAMLRRFRPSGALRRFKPYRH